MAYKALYRTYRPQKFSEVVGQDAIVRTLQNALKTNKTTHAYLFSGPRGTGKTSVARILAKALNCDKGPTSEPCDDCQTCQEIVKGSSPDVIEIDAASNNGVEEIREIRDKVKFLPTNSKYKIYIIDEVHMLSQSAFNALLKTLEEPPKHVVFILATTEPHKVLPTILSRCQRYDFRSLSVNDISVTIKSIANKENITISEEAVVGISEAAEGGLRDALSYLDQAIAISDEEVNIDDVNSVTGNLSNEKMIELASYFEQKQIAKACATLNELINMGKEVSKIISGLLQFYRDVLMYKNIKDDKFTRYIFTKQQFIDLANTIEERKVFYYIDVLSDAQLKVKNSTTPQIFLEVSIIKLINVSGDDLDLLTKVRDLEERMNQLEANKGTSSSQFSLSASDVEKINILEEKINRIINELTKYDSSSMQNRIKALEEATPTEKSIPRELQSAVDLAQEDIQFLKVAYKALQNKVDNVRTENIEELMERLVVLEDTLRRNRPTINYTEIEKFLQKQLENFTPEVTSFEQPTVQIDIVKLFEERIGKLETNVYKIISGQLAPTPTPKKSKGKDKYTQPVLFGDEIVNIDEIMESQPQKADFGDLNIDVPLPKEEVEVKEDYKDNKEIEVKESPEKPKEDFYQGTLFDTETIEEEVITNDENEVVPQEQIVQEQVVQEQSVQEQSVQEQSVQEQSVQEQTVLNEIIFEQPKPSVHQTTDIQHELEDEKPFIQPKIKESNLSPAERALNKSVENLGKANARSKQESNLFASEREELMREVQGVKQSEPKAKEESVVSGAQDQVAQDQVVQKPIVQEQIAQEQKPQKQEEQESLKNELDEYERYDVAVVERILTSSLSPEARNEKAKITNLWRNLTFAVSTADKGIAELLSEGVVVAVGNYEFIIVHPEAAYCNQVMRRKFKRRALKILKDLLLTDYNYMALPEDVWKKKRTEYVNDYNIGIHPKLTPIDDPRLKVIIDSEEMTPEQQLTKKVVTIFGDDPCIEIKKRSESE